MVEGGLQVCSIAIPCSSVVREDRLVRGEVFVFEDGIGECAVKEWAANASLEYAAVNRDVYSARRVFWVSYD